MAKSSHSNNFLLSALLVFVMIVVLVTSSFFYFNMLTENNLLNAHVVYGEKENESIAPMNTESNVADVIENSTSNSSTSK